jgi:hypothetical protein
VCDALLDRLHRPENADLLPFFARSGVLHHLGIGMAETVLSNPRWWTPSVFALTQANFQVWNDQTKRCRQVEFRSMAASPVEKLTFAGKLEQIAEECRRQNYRNVAVYGAGGHTRQLLRFWRQIPQAPDISLVLVTDVSEADVFEGIPIVAVDRTTLADHDAVLLSSHRFETEMAQTFSQLHPDKPLLRLYTRSW